MRWRPARWSYADFGHRVSAGLVPLAGTLNAYTARYATAHGVAFGDVLPAFVGLPFAHRIALVALFATPGHPKGRLGEPRAFACMRGPNTNTVPTWVLEQLRSRLRRMRVRCGTDQGVSTCLPRTGWATKADGRTRRAELSTEVGLRQVMGKFAAEVAVLTADGQGGHGMTANSFTSVSFEPPLVLCCVSRSARMHEVIK